MLATILTALVLPHGGSHYRGPGDLVPPPPRPPRAAIILGRGQAGGQLPDDLCRWEFWWAFNRERWIEPHRCGVSAEFVAGHVAPTVRRALESLESPKARAAALLALGKIGGADATLTAQLTSRHRTPRDAAVLALGLTGGGRHADLLAGLALDSARGRRAIRQAQVPMRTRAHAIYALATAHHHRPHPTTGAAILSVATRVLRGASLQGDNQRDATLPEDKLPEDLVIAAVHALLPLANAAPRVADSAIELLQPIRGGARERVARLVTARILAAQGDSKRIAAATRRWTTAPLAPSSVLSLRVLLDVTQGQHKRGIVERLTEALQADDEMTRCYATMSLGETGAANARLLDRLRTGSKLTGKPWSALALGVAHRKGLLMPAELERARVDVARCYRETKIPYSQAGLAVALGLLEARAAAPGIASLLKRRASQDELAGYSSIALTLLQHRNSLPFIRDLLRKSGRRPERLFLMAWATAIAEDTASRPALLQLVRQKHHMPIGAGGLVLSLGQLGDEATARELVAIVKDSSLSEGARATAISALGEIACARPRRWNHWITVGMDYRVATTALTNGFDGIWDTL